MKKWWMWYLPPILQTYGGEDKYYLLARECCRHAIICVMYLGSLGWHLKAKRVNLYLENHV